MNNTTVTFHTNVDCCIKFMNNISGLPNDGINPLVGDLIRVYHDSDLEIYMKVVDRTWRMTDGANPQLTCELWLTTGWTIPLFEEMLRSQNLQW